MIEILKKFSPYKHEADRTPTSPMGRWVRRSLALAAAAAFLWPLAGVVHLQNGGWVSDQKMETMLLCALASTLLVTLLKIDLVGRIEHNTRNRKERSS